MCLAAAAYFVPAQWLGRLLPGQSTVDSDAVAFRPGRVFATAGRVDIEGLERFEPDGEILFVTVSIDSDVSVLDWVESSLDDYVELRTRASVYGDRSSQDHREHNAMLMRTAKETALIAALDRLGLDATEGPSGVAFSAVIVDTAASESLEPGDVIVAVDGEPVTTVESLVRLMAVRLPGETAVLTVQHGERPERQVPVVLGAHPDNDGGFIGLHGVTERVELRDLPFGIDISPGSVGGPSAGLAFALTLLDLLTPGDLTGGLAVAVTGSISAEGGVGAVGGVRQKAAAARRAGADLFLVPQQQADQAAAGGAGMSVFGVASLGEALAVLGEHGGDVADLALSPASTQPLPAGMDHPGRSGP